MTPPIPRLLQAVELGALWATTFLFPLLVLPGITYDEFKVPKMALLLAGVGVVAGARVARAGLSEVASLDRRMLLVAGLVVIPLALSWTFSSFKEWSLVGQYLRYQGLLPYLLFAAYGVLVATSFKGRVDEIAWALTLSGSLTGLYSVVQAFHLDPLFVVGGSDGPLPAFSTIGNSNFSGGWHAIVLPVSLGLLFHTRGRKRETAVVTSLLISCGVLFSFSQGAWLAALGSVIAFAGLVGSQRLPRAAVFGLVGAALIAFVAAGAVTAVMISESAASLLGVTIQDRAWGWEAAIDSWRDHPVIGRGPNTFALFAHEYSPFNERFHLGYRDDPHSVPLFFLASTGVLGAVGYVSAVGSAIWLSSRSALRRKDPLTIGLAAALIAYGIQALVSLDDPTLRLAFWGIGGAAFAATFSNAKRPAVGFKKPSALNAGVAAIIAILVVVLAGFSAWRFLEADRSVRAGTDAALDNNAVVAVEAFERARNLRDDRWYGQLAGKNIGELATRRGAAGAPLFDQMQKHFVTAIGPPSPFAVFTEARLTDAWAEKVDPAMKERALQLLRQAHEIDPGELDHALYLASALADIGEHKEALEVLESYLTYDIQDSRFWGTWALVKARAGRHSEAWAVIRSRDLRPTDPRVEQAIQLLID